MPLLPSNANAIPDLRSKIRNLLFVLVPTLVILVFVLLRKTDSAALARSMDRRFIGAIVILMITKWLVDGFRLQQIVRFSGGKVSYWRSTAIFMASIFGSNITPFYTGGIATQVYFLAKFAISVGRSAAISVIYALLNLAVNLVFSVIVLTSPSPVAAGPHRIALVGVASTMVILAVLAFIFMRFPARTERWLRHLLRRRPAVAEHAVAGLHEFTMGFASFFEASHGAVALLLLISFLSQFLSLLFTPLVFGALGIEGIPVKRLLLTQAGVQFSSSVGGTPGGVGIIEGIFALFFGSFAGSDTAAVTLLWRLATYYIPTLVGAVVFFLLLRQESVMDSGLTDSLTQK